MIVDEVKITLPGVFGHDLLFGAEPLIHRLRALGGWGGCHTAHPFGDLGGHIEDAHRWVDIPPLPEGRDMDGLPPMPEGKYKLVLVCWDDTYTLYFTSSLARDRAIQLLEPHLD